MTARTDHREDSSPDARTQEPSNRPSRSGWWWAIGILTVFMIELAVYGARGHLEVCVGKQGHTDFALLGQARTDDNRWKFPRCERRLNLGLKPGFTEREAEARKQACRGATLLRHKGEREQCIAGEGSWLQQLRVEHCWPWHRHFVRHLLWFLPS